MKKLKYVVLTLIIGILLTGCQNDNATSNGESASRFQDGEEVHLRILWPGTSESEKQVAVALQDQVKEKYPEINIEYIYLNWTDMEKKMTVMVQSGDVPDLMLIQDITNPVAMDALEPLDDYLNETINEDKFLAASWESMKSGDTLYGIPGLAIIYSHVANTELFDEIGISVEDLQTWEDVIEASHLIKEKTGKSGYAMANGGEGRFTFRDFMMVSLSNGITPDQIEPEYKQQYIEVLELFNALAADMPKSQITWQYPELFKAWENGDIGMMHTGNYFTPNLIAHGTKAMDFTEPFAFPAGPSVDETQIMVGTVGMSMFKDSQSKEAAWKVIEELMSPEILGLWGGSINTSAGTYIDSAIIEEVTKEVYPEVYKQHNELNAKWSELAEKYGVPIPSILGQPQMEKAMQDSLTKMLDGKLTPEEAYEELVESIGKIKSQFE